MNDFRDRVKREQNELAIKISRLQPFLSGSVYGSLSSDEQTRLSDQLYYMGQYNRILLERIVAFPKTTPCDDNPTGK